MKRIVSLATLAFTLSLSAHAQEVKVEKYVLPNGMKVILHEDHALPVATVNIWYSVGSKDEPPHRSGFAHLFEHLMFMGTKRVPTGQFDKIMEGGGGSNNASTAEDRTNYYDVGPANLLPTLLWLEADRLEALGKNIDQKKLNLQRDVVKNERRQNTENTPYGKAYEAINGLMYPEGHPYHTSVIGSMTDLDNATVKDVQEFFATYYVPNNASLVVSGDFQPGTIKPMIASLFGTLPREAAIRRKAVPDPHFKGVRRQTFQDEVQASKVIMVWHSPASYRPGDAEMNLAAQVLSDGFTSRLYQRLVVKDKLATEVGAFQEGRLLGSLFYIDATAAKGADLKKLEAAIDDEVGRLRKQGPTAGELQRQQAKLEVGVVNSLQSVQRTADQLNEYEFYLGNPDSYRRVLDTYRAATPKDVRDVVARTLDPNARLILHVVPATSKSSTPARPERFAQTTSSTQTSENPRDVRPPVAPPADFVPPTAETFTLSNGLTVNYWRRPEVPLMTLSLQIAHGADLDPQNKIGLASLTASMLDEGAGSRDAAAFERDLETLGADFSASAGNLATTAALSVLSRNFDRALPIYADAILRPHLGATEFARVQRVRVADLEQTNDNPAAVASKVARREFFGASHPLGRPAEGTVSGVRAVTPEDLRQERDRLFQPQNATLYAAGSLPADELKAELEKAFGGWKNDGPALPPASYGPPKTNGLRVVLVDRPGAVQTNIRFYLPAPNYSDPSREALESLGTILGGTFTSRLNQNLREDKGYTYGASARYAFTPQLGYLVAGADVRTDVTGASLKEFLSEFKRIQGGDVTEAEAATAASTRRAETIASLGTLQGLIAVAEGYALNGRPFGDLGPDLRTIAGLSAADLDRTAGTAVPLQSATIALVGDRAKIEKQLAGLGLPTPEVVKP